MDHRVLAGLPHPLGATWDGSGVNFALFSANATKVELCLFDPKGRREIARIALPEQTHEVWHGYLSDIRPGQLYGYRVHGPYAPEEGHRFNPNKLLVDPYARRLSGDLVWHDALFGYRIGASRGDLSMDRRDSARMMPKCVVVDPAHSWGIDVPPRRPWADSVIYEAHVKGMTQLRDDVPPQLRGTFAGLAEPRVIDHLVRLGITAVELLPIQAFVDDRHLADRGLRNYWGYSPLCYHAPAPRYISPGHGIDEFRFMVRRLHEANIEVILDVVYNHTCEAGAMGPTLSFRGIDNASYYTLADDRRHYYDTTGCGNTVNLHHPRVLQMVTDSLRYWVQECHVDGFRFDLAATLGRRYDAFEPNSVFFETIAQDPVLQAVKLIAEPWDLGPNGHQLGSFPPNWAEWSDFFRDGVRSFWRGDQGSRAGVAEVLLGSAPKFEHRGRKPWASVNFVTAHDGFTLVDLWSYDAKHNEANLEDNNDGHNDNRSWNCGVEGPTDDPGVPALRDKLRRACLVTLLASHGTPMLLMGDELGRSQGGNNNAYCQDNEISWLNWSDADEGFHAFVGRLTDLRHRRPLLRAVDFRHGNQVGEAGIPDVLWLRCDAGPMSSDDWNGNGSSDLILMLSGRGEASLLLVLNPAEEDIEIALPAREQSVTWRVLVDSNAGVIEPEGHFRSGDSFVVPSRSAFILETMEPLS